MRKAVLGFTTLCLLVPSCSLGPRQDWGDAMRDAYATARREATAEVRAAVDLKVIETNIRETPKPVIARLEGVVDFRRHDAELVGTTKARPIVVFDDLVAYLPRSESSRAAGGKQHWTYFDFKREPSVDVDDLDRRRAVGAGLISPALAVEILGGVLTGSIERVGVEKAAGERATHYKARFSQDAVAREMDDEDRREGLLRVFESLGVKEDVFPGEVWLDSDGVVRRILFVLRQQKDRVNAFEMRAAWEFYDFGAAAPISTPARTDSVRSTRVKDFIEEFIREAA
ncbi:MAG TPA: hypothetical protein VFA34_04035 [Actinomycetota bacterium]|jgi:hypothetical protein|nr:hypothetical protein [Actinomycetota bacterium]